MLKTYGRVLKHVLSQLTIKPAPYCALKRRQEQIVLLMGRYGPMVLGKRG